MSNHNPAAELIALGALALGISAGTVLVDEELAYVLHTQLQTNTETSFETAKELLYNDIDLDGDRAVLHKKFDGSVAKADGSVDRLKWQTLYFCRKVGARWKIAGFVGYMPHPLGS